MKDIAENLEKIKEKMARAAERAGRRAEDIELIAVSKTVGPEAVREAYRLGVRRFGENRVQELLDKQRALSDLDAARWDCIGQLQTNKVKYLPGRVDRIHSLDRPALAKEIQKVFARHNAVAKVLIEINVGGEDSKAGLPLEALMPFAAEVAKMPNLSLHGLMCIPPPLSKEQARPYFQKMHEAFVRLKQELPDQPMDCLSMGMSTDFETAIEEGSNMVRIGTAIFGQRT